MQVDVFNTSMDKVGSADLPEAVFGQEVKEGLLWEQVRAQRASKRSGTHATRDRAQVSGTGKKPMKQKGSGRARQGSERAPHFVGGGVAMGPRPRDYSYRLPRSARKSALRSALSARAKSESLTVLEGFALDAPKTKDVVTFLEKLGSVSALVIDTENNNLARSTGNLKKTKFLTAEAVNVYDILNHDKLVLTQAALAVVIEKAGLGKTSEAAEA